MGRAPIGISPKVIARIRQQAAGNFGMNAEVDPTKVTAEMPSPVSYGVFGNSYAQSLAAKAQDPYFGGGYDAALRQGAEQESADYDRRLAASNAQAMMMQKAAAKYGLFKELLTTQGSKALPGEFAIGEEGLEIDPTIQAVHRTNDVNAGIAGNHKTEADAAAALYGAGIKPNIDDVNAAQGNPIFGTPAKYGVFPNQVAPEDEAKQVTADASMLKAKADMVDANNPRKYSKSGGSGGGTTFSLIQPIPGVGMQTTKTKDPNVIKQLTSGNQSAPVQGAEPPVGQTLRGMGYKVQKTPHGTYQYSKAGVPSITLDSRGNGAQ